MGVVAPPQAPPFPFTVEQFVAEVSPPSAAATASQACAAFAQLATKVVVPETFRAAVPAVLGLVAREGDGLLEAKESALASDSDSDFDSDSDSCHARTGSIAAVPRRPLWRTTLPLPRGSSRSDILI